jgi:hypothetical protein
MVMMEVMVWLTHQMKMDDVWAEMEEWRWMDEMKKGCSEYFE